MRRNISLSIIFGLLMAVLIFFFNTTVLGKADNKPDKANSNSSQDYKVNGKQDKENNKEDKSNNGKGNENNDHEKMTICHGTGSAANPFVKITVSKNADNGHFNANGTPRSGHLNDILLTNPNDDCPSAQAPTPSSSPGPNVNPAGGITQENNQSQTVNVTQSQAVTGKVAGVSVTQLPKTGLSVLAWSALALVPIGFKLRKFRGDNSSDDTPNGIWEGKQFKNILR